MEFYGLLMFFLNVIWDFMGFQSGNDVLFYSGLDPTKTIKH